MIPGRYLQRLLVIKALVLSSGAAVSAAAAETSAGLLTDLPWLQILVAAVIGLVGGTCNVLMRYLPTVYDTSLKWSWRAEVAVALVISPASGAAAYVMASQAAISAAAAGLISFSVGVVGSLALRGMALRIVAPALRVDRGI